MMKTKTKPMDLIKKAFDYLKGRWGAILVFFLPIIAISVILSMVSPTLVSLIAILIAPFISLEIYNAVKEDRNPNFKNIFEFSKEDYIGITITNLIVSLFVFLWSLLFIIPGIIFTYAYSRAIYIKYKNPKIDYMEAIKLSKDEMDGHKSRFFLAHFIAGLPVLLLSLLSFSLVVPLIMSILSGDGWGFIGSGIGIFILIIILMIVSFATGLFTSVLDAVFHNDMDKYLSEDKPKDIKYDNTPEEPMIIYEEFSEEDIIDNEQDIVE